VRRLRETVSVSCDDAMGDPVVLLTPSLFGGAERWNLQTDTTASLTISPSGGRECDVAWVDDGVRSSLLVWDRTVARRIALSELATPDARVVFRGAPSDDIDGLACGANQPLPIVWSGFPEFGEIVVDAVDEGEDGCLAIAYQAEEGSAVGHLCGVPPELVALPVGEGIFVESLPFEEILTFGAPDRQIEIGRGELPSTFEAVAYEADGRCVGRNACGERFRELVIEPPSSAWVRSDDNNAVELEAGGVRETVRILRAVSWDVTDSACLDGSEGRTTDVDWIRVVTNVGEE
jgi:hypothetical protein